ncbi:MAG: endonuclease, partial [Aureispira sp.]|nr:endonuclease [Aureispira sp.]
KKNITSLNDKNTQAKYQRIGSKLKNAFIKRTEQARAIAKSIKECPHEVIVCGDMNDTPMSYAYHTIVKGLKDSFYEKGRGIGSTYAGKLPALRIDYILTSSTIDVYSHQVLSKTLSDHYAVTANIGL